MFFCFAVGADFPLKQQMVFDYHLFYMTYWVLHHLMFQIRVILNPCCRVFWSGRKSLWGSDFFSTVQTAVYVIFRQTGGTLCCLWVSLCGCCFVRMRQAAACWCMALQMLHDAAWCFSVPQTEAQSLSGREDKAWPTQTSSGPPSPPVLPDVPVIAGVEEGGGAAEDQEDQEELEFPHDLLPSLDFSSEFNIWESSLGYVEGVEHSHPNTPGFPPQLTLNLKIILTPPHSF